MSEEKANSKWSRYQNVPFNTHSPMVTMLNEHEFILASEKRTKHDGQKLGIQKYNIHKNQWNEVITYSNYSNIFTPRITCDAKTNKLYLFHSVTMNQGILIIDMKTKKVLREESIPNKVGPGLTFANGIIHQIGGLSKSNHLSWNPENDEIKQIHDFAPEFTQIFGSISIYVASKDVILLIGGMQWLGQKSVGIWRFDMKLNKWENMINGKDFIFYKVSATLSSNEHYVVVGGGKYFEKGEGVQESARMFVLNIDDESEYKLNECRICCPIGGVHNIVRTGGIKDEYLVVGWIKELFKTLKFKDLTLPPMYIMQLIAIRYNEEEIHWIEAMRKGDGSVASHYAIKLKHFLSGLM